MHHDESSVEGRVAVRSRPRREYGSALFVALAVVSGTAASGCASLFQAPEVRLASVRVVGLGLLGGTLEAGVLVSNPNGYALRSGQLSYALDVAEPGDSASRSWTPLATGRLDREVQVPAGDSVIVGIPIEFTWEAMEGTIRSLLDRGTFDYRVSGALELRSPLRRTVPYRHTGTLTVGR
jgi:hypothetical protein